MNRELLATFIEEANEGFPILEENLLALEDSPEDQELINAIFRTVHSLKGSAGLIGLGVLGDFLHHMEELLHKVRSRQVEVTTELINVLLQGTDAAREMVARIDAGEELEVGKAERVVENLIKSFQAPTGGKRLFQIELRPSPQTFTTGADPLMLIGELAEMGELTAVDVQTDDLPTLEELDPYRLYLGWSLELRTEQDLQRVKDVFIFVQADPDASVTITPLEEAAVKAKTPLASRLLEHSVRVPTTKLDALMNQVGQLVIARARMVDAVLGAAAASPEVMGALEDLDQGIRDLQDLVMSTRMVPVATIFNRFPRIVRELALDRGKEVRLELKGSDTELDKTVVERLMDPITHMLRNAVDHGIETPGARRLAEKEPIGTITLHAYQKEGSIVLEVVDDGAGIDPNRVKEAALKKGLIDEGTALKEEEMLQLLFLPGFSTAGKVTDISGRGVGLDVVKENINQLRGSIEILSSPGMGTTFRILLPLTLAILDGMVIRLGAERFVIPLSAIVEFIWPDPKDLKRLGPDASLLRLRGEYVPVLSLARLFNLSSRDDNSLLVLVQDGSRRFCLAVDDILGQQQIVIKSLRDNYRHVDGLAGATILGDGGVAMIVDVSSLSRLILRGVGQ
ncbi:MAG: chemotaxis protein CheA [Limnochordia bacterium]